MTDQDKAFKLKTVMIVDDSYIDRYIAEKVMMKYLFASNILSIDTAHAALTMLSSIAATPEKLPELILLDVNMPEMSGFDFLEAYEEMPVIVKETCKIMMLTTSLNPKDRDEARNNPYVVDFLSKPLGPDQLIQIEKRLELSGK